MLSVSIQIDVDIGYYSRANHGVVGPIIGAIYMLHVLWALVLAYGQSIDCLFPALLLLLRYYILLHVRKYVLLRTHNSC
jgi:hypothetical protein